MEDGGSGSFVGKAAVAILLVPAFFLVFLFGSLLMATDASSQGVCDPSGSAYKVDPKSVPAGPIEGYGKEQLVNAAYVMLAAQKLGLSARDQQIGVSTAMGESTLRVLDYGDDVGPDSRGLFQQRDNGAWGSYSDRMDPFISSTNFFKVEMTIENRESMPPYLVSHQVQRNANPRHYVRFWEPAGKVVQALAGVKGEPGDGGSTPKSGGGATPKSTYDLDKVQPQTAAVANTVGPMFGIKTIGGWRDPNVEKRDPGGHPAGLALDFMTNDIPDGKETGDALASYLQAQASEIGVKYIIWRQRIWSVERADEGWRHMRNRGNPTENHMDHVHLSLTGNGSGDGSAGGSCGLPGGVSKDGWAAPAQGPITSPFGRRSPPVQGGSEFHRGIDMAAGGCDGPIWAAHDGQVVRAGAASGYGNLIEIDHGGGATTRYGHMFNSGVLVKIGDQVKAGQQIAKTGRTGRSTGCHLHFEVLVKDDAVDPQAFLTQVGVTIK